MAAESRVLDYDTVVIGAGFSGMYMLHRLRDLLGMRVKVFERGAGVGGTWYWNRYPGARCDSDSYIYCYSFDKDLLQEWNWTMRYPEQPEILRYLDHFADRYDLRKDIQFETRVTEARYDEGTNTWTLATDRGDHVTARYVVAAIGCLSAGNIPDVPGRDSFQGEMYHTGSWPHEPVSFAGKRVAVIGTGSSGTQAIPVIAAQADRLTVFQRTAQFTIPAQNRPMTQEFRDDVKSRYDEIWRLTKETPRGQPFGDTDPRPAIDIPDEERTQLYEAAWEKGGWYFTTAFPDLYTNEASNETAAEFVRGKIREIVRDPATVAKLTPRGYPYGTKRALMDTNYYETYNRDNVTLVDLREESIEAITPRGIRTTGCEYEFDTIVFATGFDAMTGPLKSIDIRGRGGMSIRDRWADGPHTYLGLAVAGFPNLFALTGPGSPSVLTHMPVAIEQHVEWVSDLLSHWREPGFDVIEAMPDAEDAWDAHVREAAEKTIYVKGESWYLGSNVPGKPRVFMPYAGGMLTYRERCNDVAAKGYEGFAIGRPLEAISPADAQAPHTVSASARAKMPVRSRTSQ